MKYIYLGLAIMCFLAFLVMVSECNYNSMPFALLGVICNLLNFISEVKNDL